MKGKRAMGLMGEAKRGLLFIPDRGVATKRAIGGKNKVRNFLFNTVGMRAGFPIIWNIVVLTRS